MAEFTFAETLAQLVIFTGTLVDHTGVDAENTRLTVTQGPANPNAEPIQFTLADVLDRATRLAFPADVGGDAEDKAEAATVVTGQLSPEDIEFAKRRMGLGGSYNDSLN